MDFICRICQQSEVEKLISISCTAATQKRICDLISTVTGSSVEEFDRLPQHVCNECFCKLDRTYRLWELCRGAARREVLHQQQQIDRRRRCRICCALIESEACKEWNKAIDMVQHLTGALLQINDNSHSWFVCINCLLDMDAAYEFKSKCIESEASLLKTTSFMWERMEVDPCNPEHLVMDLYAEAVQKQDVLGGVHCSVCLLEVEIQQLGQKCEGCMLQFRNYDEIRSVQASLCAEENSKNSLVEIDSVWLEENLSQDFIDDERDEKFLIEDDVMFEIEMDTEAGNDNHAEAEVTESNKTCLVYNGNSKTQYEISEKFPDDPYPKARRVGPSCCKCLKFFNTRLELQAHTKQRHKKPTGQGEFSCDVCLSLFADQHSLELHRAKLQTFFYDFCRSCQVVLSSPCILLQHKKRIHGEFETVENESATSIDGNITRAKEGPEVTTVQASLIKPTNPQTEGSSSTEVETKFKTENLVTYECCLQKCSSCYLSEEQLLKHLNTAHYQPTQLLDNACHYCKEKFPNEAALMEHCNRKVERQMYRCLTDGCGFIHMFKNNMIQHCSKKPHIRSTTNDHIQKQTTFSPPLDLKHSSLLTNKPLSVDKNSTRATEATEVNDHRMVEASLKNATSQPRKGSFPMVVKPKFKMEILETYDCCLQNCRNRYSSEEQLLQHLNTAHYQPKELLEHVCQYCEVEFPNETALLKHSNRKVGINMYRCLTDGCGFTSTVIRSIILHCNRKHQIRSTNELQQKPTRESRPMDLEQLSVVAKESVSVDKNSTKTTEETALDYHRMVEDSAIKPTNQPTEESSPTEDETNFKTDILVTYECCLRNCKNRYSSEEQLTKHMNTAHDQSNQVLENVCQYCNVKFLNETAFMNHRTGKVERTIYRCSIDGCCFTRMIKNFIIKHCSREPHVKYTSAHDKKPSSMIKSRPLDFKHFSVVRKMDDNTDVVERKSELCCTCFLLFDSKAELTQHCEQHSTEGEWPFHCQVCGRGFRNQSGYTSHRNLTDKPIHYFCRVCEKILWTKVDYIMHRAALHFPEDKNAQIETMVDDFFTCCGCKEQFGTEAELVEHRREEHQPPSSTSSKPIPKVAKCDYCHNFFYKPWELEKHITLYESRITYKCKLTACAFKTKDIERIRRHILGATHRDVFRSVVRSADPSEYFCCIKGCEFRCHDYDTMIKHGTAMHAQEREYFSIAHSDRTFKCPVCGKGFSKEISVINHKHRRQKSQCHGCELYIPREERSSHVRCLEKLRVKCEICDKLMASKKSLKEHVKAVHSNESEKYNKHVCNICGKKVKQLLTHMESHKNERNWECKICAARFNHVHQLRIHQRVHLNEKKYACRHGCEKRYKAPGDRDRHERLVHLGITPFRCDFCEASFIRERDLRLHQRKHTGIKLYPCPHCDASFNKKSEYDDHCRQCKVRDQPFHCPVCSRGFRNQSTYTNHRNLTEKSSHYFCRVCEKILWTKLDYRIHRTALHFPEDKNAQIETMADDFFTCCGCKEQFGTEAELVEHRREKHPPPSSTSSKVAKCDYCHNLFYKPLELEKHTTRYESRITYKCKLPSCAFTTKELERIRRHILGSTNHRDAFKSVVRISADPSEYGCCILGCEFRSQDYDTMIKHGVAMHAEKREYFSIVHSDRKFKCLVCGKGFVQEVTMINHKHRRQPHKYQCQGCELYVPKKERSSHARCVEKLRVRCEICDKLLISQMGLKQHIKMVHSNESEKYNKHVCNICGKKVKHLLTHMEMHKNERNWECKICAARFNHVILLRNHHQRVHLNEKKYACRHGCERRYKAPGDRDRHERLVHLGITPFRCDFCEASFIRQRDLRLHQRKHTGLKLYPCPHCDASFNKKSQYDDHCRQCKGAPLL